MKRRRRGGGAGGSGGGGASSSSPTTGSHGGDSSLRRRRHLHESRRCSLVRGPEWREEIVLFVATALQSASSSHSPPSSPTSNTTMSTNTCFRVIILCIGVFPHNECVSKALAASGDDDVLTTRVRARLYPNTRAHLSSAFFFEDHSLLSLRSLGSIDFSSPGSLKTDGRVPSRGGRDRALPRGSACNDDVLSARLRHRGVIAAANGNPAKKSRALDEKIAVDANLSYNLARTNRNARRSLAVELYTA